MKGARVKLDVRFPLVRCRITGTIEWFDGPPMPGLTVLNVLSEENSMLQFKLTLPPATAPDVVSQEVSVSINGSPAVVQTVPVAQTEVAGFEGPDGAEVDVTVVQIDDAGNRSEPREQLFTLTDTIPPSQPGEVGLVVTGES